MGLRVRSAGTGGILCSRASDVSGLTLLHVLGNLLSLIFYARFYRRFSAAGSRERSRAWQPYAESLRGQRWLVTGASGGIGATVAREAHARGAEVLAVARSGAKLGELSRECGGDAWLKPLAVDLASIQAIRGLVRGLSERGETIDVLLTNVGVLLNAHSLTGECFEPLSRPICSVTTC